MPLEITQASYMTSLRVAAARVEVIELAASVDLERGALADVDA